MPHQSPRVQQFLIHKLNTLHAQDPHSHVSTH